MTHLGRGVWADLGGSGTVRLVTSDGTDTICLDPDVVDALEDWLDEHYWVARDRRTK